MGRRYSGEGEAAVGALKTVLNLISAATVRPKLYDILIGSDAAVADTATKFLLRRFTAVGTEGSGFTPVKLDPGDPVSLADCGVAHSAEPTYTAASSLLSIAINQRATIRWVASPRGELVAPATASNGIGCQSENSTGTAIHQCGFHWEE